MTNKPYHKNEVRRKLKSDPDTRCRYIGKCGMNCRGCGRANYFLGNNPCNSVELGDHHHA